jgi:hypothetical protein
MSSLTIFIIAGVLLFLLLLWIFRKRKGVLLFIVAAVGVAAWFGYKEYFRTNKDLGSVKADIKISATDLIHAYETDDTASNKKYLGQVIETSGTLKAVEKDDSGFFTIVLADQGSVSSIRCSIDTVHKDDASRLVIGSSVTVRGACTGFNKDEMGLGSDVILNRCVVVHPKN